MSSIHYINEFLQNSTYNSCSLNITKSSCGCELRDLACGLTETLCRSIDCMIE